MYIVVIYEIIYRLKKEKTRCTVGFLLAVSVVPV